MDISTIGSGALTLLVFIYGAAIGKLSAFGVSFGILVAGMVASYFISKFIFPNTNLLFDLFTAGFYFTYLLSPAIKFNGFNEGIITMLLVLGAAGAGMGFLLKYLREIFNSK